LYLDFGISNDAAADVADRSSLGPEETVVELGSPHQIASYNPNSCLGLEPASHKRG